jgi:uncharacterized protein
VILADTGPLVALIDTADEDHAACRAFAPQTNFLLTTWPCLTEAMYILGRKFGFKQQRDLWHQVEIEAVVMHDSSAAEVTRMQQLMTQYQDLPMDLADASLVAAAEALNRTRIFTLDDDFKIYRLQDGRAFDIVP